MLTKRVKIHSLVFAAVASLSMAAAHATTFSGTLYYTNYTGGQNVNKVDYNYDDSTNTFTLGAASNIASTNGADGIIFSPNGNILVGGQTSGNVYEVNPSSGAIVGTQSTGTASYHLALDPSGNVVYTSAFGGSLNTVALPVGGGSTNHAITGDDGGLTQLAFGTGGTVFYVNGQPNGGGNLGTIDLSTYVTTRLHSNVIPAHGIVFDPYTDLITMFGAGQTGTMSAADGSGLLTSGYIFPVGDFDQGAVDGLGHALVAGTGAITFIDYSQSHDITNPDYTASIGGFSGIDDVAPLIGAGAPPPPSVPEPPTIALACLGLMSLIMVRRRTQD